MVCRSHKDFVGISFTQLTEQQKIDFVQCTFARADAWLNWDEDFTQDRPLHSFFDILKLGSKGYYRLYEYLPIWAQVFIAPPLRLFAWAWSYLPRIPLAFSPSSMKESAL